MNIFGADGSGGDDMLKNIIDQLKQEDSVLRVQLNDQRLMKLAEYDATQGFMKLKVEDTVLQIKFNQLKSLVKDGECTLKDLETEVYSKWGITEDPRSAKLMQEQADGNPTMVTGFNPVEIDVADIPEDSKENH